ncbi:MAG: helix-turn-helix domain-containing protein [Mangrovibacterium sp.]
MIQQPELGKKIAELRKAKGLTQEELVAKCNLNVRTLQRIESGEATPRTYTLRLIFEALEYSFDEPNEKGLILKWLEQFYICFIDLFNLKTKTMKKISILSIMATAILFGIIAVNNRLSAQDSSHQKNDVSEFNKVSNSDLPFFDFSCYGCTERKGLVIGRDISFKLNGVKVKNVRLLVIDKDTREFDALFVEGQFLERKVTINYPEEWLTDGSLQYSADNIDKSKHKITLKGNAKVYDKIDKGNPNDEEFIEADEIAIMLK